ncbi:histone-lysine N-methyltransferase SETMAR [Trichonephila clavipes]|nr:histone-lysine N-methyltransferase SETMAR [Trichonephila clavipes]
MSVDKVHLRHCILYEFQKGSSASVACKNLCAAFRKGTSSATVPKPSIHQRKVLLCLGWNRKGPLYYELLKQGKTFNVDLYCNELDKLNAAIKEKRPALASRKGIVFHHENARPHTAMVTQQKLNALGWEVLDHPPYSPDIAPSDYSMFRSLQNYLTEKIQVF